jgi:hypothetical protein
VRRYPAGTKEPDRPLTVAENEESALYTWHAHIYDSINGAGSEEKYRQQYPKRADWLDKAEWWSWKREDQTKKEFEIFRENLIACDEWVRKNKRTPRKAPSGREKRELTASGRPA